MKEQTKHSCNGYENIFKMFYSEVIFAALIPLDMTGIPYNTGNSFTYMFKVLKF